MKIVSKRLADLKRPERNVRLHTDKQLKEFRRSVEMFGQIRPLVVDETGMILAGNGLYETLLAMGKTEADCYVVQGLSDAQKKKLMLADNRVFNLGVDDHSTLEAFIMELKDDLDIPGFEDDLLKAMIMEADEASEVLSEYGIIDTDRIDTMNETKERYKVQETAAAQKAEEVKPSLELIYDKPISVDKPLEDEKPEEPIDIEHPKQRYILCPKCGERIWL